MSGSATAKAVCCDACGIEAPDGAAAWFTVHFSARNLELLCTASPAELQYIGERRACSRECLHKLIEAWAVTWKAKRAKAAGVSA